MHQRHNAEISNRIVKKASPLRRGFFFWVDCSTIVLMETILLTAVLGMLGATLGSFAVASVWRLRAWQLASDQKQGETLTQEERTQLQRLQKLRGKSTTKDRSVCLHCGRTLGVIDLIPVISWMGLRGKCRTCKQPIGRTEFIAEVGLGIAVAASFLVWPYGMSDLLGVGVFIVWVAMLTLLTIHIVYDAKWFLLLDVISIAISGLAVAFVLLLTMMGAWEADLSQLQNSVLALLALPGFYGMLYVVSKGQWIGFGDVKLLIPLAIMLPGWPEALLVLFLANVLGCLWILPGITAKKISRSTRIPFGPFLIIAWLITMLWGKAIIAAYMGTLAF